MMFKVIRGDLRDKFHGFYSADLLIVVSSVSFVVTVFEENYFLTRFNLLLLLLLLNGA